MSHSGNCTSEERAPGTHYIGGWLGPRVSLDAVTKMKISFAAENQALSSSL
jgi:hypothetical protein